MEMKMGLSGGMLEGRVECNVKSTRKEVWNE